MEQSDKKDEFYNVFTSCLDILRDNEGLTGEKALRNTTYLLILKLLEPHFKDTINIDDYEYDFSDIEDDMVELHKTKLLKMVRFTNLAKEKEDDIPNIMKYLWDDILSKHPSTKNIFLKNKGFDIKHKSTYKKIIEKFVKINLSVEQDHLGNSYEAVIKQIMTGKVLGQFFTPPQVKKMMVDLIDPQVKEDGTIDTCGDPTMGTGGFLITFLQKIIQQAKDKDIKLDWDFIKTKGLYGKEKEPDTYQLAVSNMLISTGHMFEHLDCGDSIREPITRKFDNILANPPFGITGLKYNDFQSSLKSVYVPIKSDNAVSLFIQAIIYMLNLGGKCAIVLPDGQDLFSKSNKKLVHIREYLLKTCDLNEIIYLPSGVFTYTSIKTCIFFFVKKKEGNDVLETKIKYSKTQTETGREYTFSKIHQTTNVKFYDYIGDVKNLLVEVPIEKIVSNSYSLNYAEYMEHKEDQYEEGVVVKTLGEVCNFQNGFAFKPNDYEKQNETNIGILQIKSIQNGFIDNNKISEYITENNKYKLFEIQKGNILIALSGATTGKIGIYNLEYKSYLNQRVGKITKKTGVIQKYIYYWYLCFDIESTVLKMAQGTAQPNISTNNISNIKIPIPPLEKQEEIVKYLDFIYEKANKTSQEKIKELKTLNEFCLNTQKMFGDNVVKTLGEVCDFKNGKGIKKDTLVEGEYPVIGGGQKPMGFHNEYNADENTILCSSSGAYAGFISKYNKKVWASDCFSIIPKNNSINNTYLYYLLKSIQDKIFKSQSGAAQPHVYSKDLQNIKIPIPSLERQQEIVEYCEYNDTLIQQLEKEIEHNKKQAQLFMTSIVKEISV
jgi:type I restriction enzyme S subunit